MEKRETDEQLRSLSFDMDEEIDDRNERRGQKDNDTVPIKFNEVGQRKSISRVSILKEIESTYGAFETLRESAPADKLGVFSRSQHDKLAKIFDKGNYLSRIEWIIRHYLASKKMTLAVLYFTQSEELEGRGMKNLSFYACYYSLFSVLSANMLLAADFKLEKVREISHTAVSKEILNYFVRSGVYKKDVVDLLEELRFCRELYSYHLPISGDVLSGSSALNVESLQSRLSEVLPVCLQVLEMQSYLSYYAWKKIVKGRLELRGEYAREIDELFDSVVHRKSDSGFSHLDRGDYGLLGYFLKSGEPLPITWLINDKVLEEVECAWGDEPEDGYQISSVSSYMSRVTDAF